MQVVRNLEVTATNFEMQVSVHSKVSCAPPKFFFARWLKLELLFYHL